MFVIYFHFLCWCGIEKPEVPSADYFIIIVNNHGVSRFTLHIVLWSVTK